MLILVLLGWASRLLSESVRESAVWDLRDSAGKPTTQLCASTPPIIRHTSSKHEAGEAYSVVGDYFDADLHFVGRELTQVQNGRVVSNVGEFKAWNEKWELRRQEGSCTISHSIDQREKKESVPCDETAIVGALLIERLQRDWKQILEKGNMPVHILVPSRVAAYEFKFQKVKNAPIIEFRPSNWMLSVVVDPIVVEFRDTPAQLLRVSGTKNLRKRPSPTAPYESFQADYRYDLQGCAFPPIPTNPNLK